MTRLREKSVMPRRTPPARPRAVDARRQPDDSSRAGSPPGGADDQLEVGVAPRARAPRIAAHTRAGRSGMASSRTPSGRSASRTAFISAGGAPTVPASPTPFAPSGLTGVVPSPPRVGR
jgi:hypothetical protein